MRMLHVYLLGDFRLIYDGAPVAAFFQGRLQDLITYLLLHRDAPQSRQRLAFLFWPDSVEHQARNNLRQLLYHLRRALPSADQFVLIEGKTVQWRADAPFTLDVMAYEQHLARAAQMAQEGSMAAERMALEAALAHYGGELLPGNYAAWILPERERLQQAFLDALERLTLLAEAQRDYEDALQHAERLLRHDALHETTYRRLMRLYALLGDRAQAMRVYRRCSTLLQDELGVEPNVDTQEAYRCLLQMQTPSRLRERMAAPLPRKALPDAMQRVVRERLRALSEPALVYAALAATIGGAFAFDVLVEAGGGETETLLNALDELRRRGIVRKHGDREYAFGDDGFRQVVYEELGARQRQACHRRVAAALEKVCATDLDAASEQIAAHYERAGSDTLALAYYVRAAMSAHKTRNDAAVRHLLGRALALLPALPDDEGGGR